MSPQMIFVDRIAFGGVLSLSKEIGKIRHSTVTLLLTTITEVLTDAHIYIYILYFIDIYIYSRPTAEGQGVGCRPYGVFQDLGR